MYNFLLFDYSFDALNIIKKYSGKTLDDKFY